MQDYCDKKTALVAIIGRPSAGKSSLMNSLCREKISIVTPVPQTTRNRIRGILHDEQGQIVFLDTPGLHQSAKTFNRRLRGLIQGSLKDCDLILYVVDVSRKPGAEEAEIISVLSTTAIPFIIVYNKTDLRPAGDTSREIRRIFMQQEGRLKDPVGELEISVIEERGLGELKTMLFEHAPVSEPLYPTDVYTDQDPAFRIAEIIREQAMLRSREELPHAIYVEIHDIETQEKKRLWIRSSICVENKSQIGLVVGRGGDGIKEIRQASQRELGKIFPYRIHLDLRVKCSPNWRHNEGIIARMIT